MVRSALLGLTAGLFFLSNSAAVSAADNEQQVLATFGDSLSVTTSDFSAAVRALPPTSREQARETPRAATAILDAVLLNRVLAKQAKEMGLANGPEVQAEIAQAVERVLAARRMDALEAKLVVPDFTQAAKEQYETHKVRYSIPDKVEAAHILIGKSNRTTEQAKELADDVRRQLIDGKDFGDLAAKYSDDPGSKKKGGNLGFFGRGRMVKEFEQAAFELVNKGDISPVIETQFGFHIIKLIDRQYARQLTFPEVEAQIVTPMRNRFISDEKLRLTSQIRNDPSIVLNTKEIDKLILGPSTKQPTTSESAASATEMKR